MSDRFGPLGVLALMIPQQNSNMQPEHEMLRPDGVSNQTYRFDISVQDTVPETAWLHVKTSDRIIDVTMNAIHAAFDKVNTDEVDTILHVGGALGIADIVDDLEDRLGKPVISSTSVGYWYALRMMGLDMPLSLGAQITRHPLPARFRDPTRRVS
ncbi:hypothetical protein [Gymnodinialimonas sp. 57CJ19]|uniref:aspartate racemase/maleate isomerase family protein n=1 Tax=Gymnodinialimonas sp. 57CJ19 TaxID=3138498 RepID=UPI0031343878